MNSTIVGDVRADRAVSEVAGREVGSLYAALQGVGDGRCKRGRRYEAAVVLTLLIVAKIAGEEHIAGVTQWVREREELLRQWLLRQWLPLAHAPCANTYRYVCAHVDLQALQEALVAVFPHAAGRQATSGVASEIRHLACDGKELRGPDFWFPERSTRQVTSGHGRTAIYTMRLSDELNGYLSDRWPGVQQVFQLERKVTRRSRQGTKTTHELVYGFTSLPANRASPEQVLAYLQRHWLIENRSHWRRDVTLKEDRLQLSCKAAALVISVLNCFILALFDHLNITNCRQAMRHYNAHPEKALSILTQPL